MGFILREFEMGHADCREAEVHGERIEIAAQGSEIGW
jgi:hypothetical protein